MEHVDRTRNNNNYPKEIYRIKTIWAIKNPITHIYTGYQILSIALNILSFIGQHKAFSKSNEFLLCGPQRIAKIIDIKKS